MRHVRVQRANRVVIFFIIELSMFAPPCFGSIKLPVSYL